MNEALEEKHKSNVVIFKLTEGPDSSTDVTTLLKLCSDIGCAIPTYLNGKLEIDRLKRSSNNLRPLRAQLPNKNIKRNILKSALKLKNFTCDWPKVYISPNLTKNNHNISNYRTNANVVVMQAKQFENIIINNNTSTQKQSSALTVNIPPLNQ